MFKSNQFFSQDILKISENWVLTFDFLAVAEDSSMPPPHPEDRREELRRVAFHPFCGKFGFVLTAFVGDANGALFQF